MKKIRIMIVLALINSLPTLSDESIKIIAPSSINESSLHLIAMNGSGEAIDDSNFSITKSEYYGDASIFTVDITDSTGKVKMVAGYKVDGKYVLLASSEISSDSDVVDNYNSMADEDLLDIIDIDDYTGSTAYEDFPGLEIKEGAVLLGLRAGEEEHETSEIPSNIVKKFGVDGSDGYEIDINGSKINPSNSETNYEFTITDSNGKKVAVMKSGDNPEIIDLLEIKKSAIAGTYIELPIDDPETKDIDESNGEYEGPFTIRVRFNDPIKIDGKVISQKTFEFGNVKYPRLYYEGGFKFTLDMSGEEIIFDEEELPPELAKPVVYVITGEGLITKGSVDMLSREEATKKERISDVNIEIMEKGESGFKIEKIEE